MKILKIYRTNLDIFNLCPKWLMVQKALRWQLPVTKFMQHCHFCNIRGTTRLVWVAYITIKLPDLGGPFLKTLKWIWNISHFGHWLCKSVHDNFVILCQKKLTTVTAQCSSVLQTFRPYFMHSCEAMVSFTGTGGTIQSIQSIRI